MSMCMSTCVHAYRGQRAQHVSSSANVHLMFRGRVSWWNLTLTDWPKQGDQQAPGIFQPLTGAAVKHCSTQLWQRTWRLSSGAHGCLASTLAAGHLPSSPPLSFLRMRSHTRPLVPSLPKTWRHLPFLHFCLLGLKMPGSFSAFRRPKLTRWCMAGRRSVDQKTPK